MSHLIARVTPAGCLHNHPISCLLTLFITALTLSSWLCERPLKNMRVFKETAGKSQCPNYAKGLPFCSIYPVARKGGVSKPRIADNEAVLGVSISSAASSAGSLLTSWLYKRRSNPWAESTRQTPEQHIRLYGTHQAQIMYLPAQGRALRRQRRHRTIATRLVARSNASGTSIRKMGRLNLRGSRGCEEYDFALGPLAEGKRVRILGRQRSAASIFTMRHVAR